MSRLTDLLAQVRTGNPQLADDLAAEVRALESRRAFGLNFERHQPEAVELPGRPVRRGNKVRVLSPRGSTERSDRSLWLVDRVINDTVHLIRAVDEGEGIRHEALTLKVEDVVVIAEFRDPIHPGLVSTGKVERGGDKPFHTVINAENFHALQTLLYTHEGKVDAIYIDPPYNTGAKDWKYNNDYVDGEDAYRHSKWLAFMERRLKLAQRLLNPDNSVLIVTIDEKEYLRLGLLLEQTFPEARVQMVSVGINPASVARLGYFGRSDEYAYFVMLGTFGIRALDLAEEWITTKGRTHTGDVRWDLLRRSGSSPTRNGHPETFYPFFVTDDGTQFHSVGEPIGTSASRHDTIPPPGTFAVWPIRQNGSEGRWGLQPSTVRKVLADGCLRLGETKGEQTPVYYLAQGERAKIESGIYDIVDRRTDGSVVTAPRGEIARLTVPGTQWRIVAHDATQYGTRLLSSFLPIRKFPFPKSLYAVEDTLRFALHDKPEAVVLDFFSGSGTTAHAVMRLNKQDGGRRQCISVTNNEVSVDEQKALRERGLRPGDPEWEALGICDYITKPRIRAAITGLTPDGDPIKGDYKFTDEFPMADGFEENAEFFTLTYEAPRAVQHGRAFERIAPLLWLRAGARGRRIEAETTTFDVAETYGVLFDVSAVEEFVDVVSTDAAEALLDQPARPFIAFIVTDDEGAFRMACSRLPEHAEPVRLWSSYLESFAIGAAR